MASTREDKIIDMIAKINVLYSHGIESNAKQSDEHPQTTDEETCDRKLTSDMLRKARVHADPEPGWSPEELDTLLKAINDVQTGQKEKLPIFSRAHAVKLLVIPEGKRVKLQLRAIKKDWNLDQLENEIARRYGRRSDRGHRPGIAGNDGRISVQFTRMAGNWRRGAHGAEGESPPPIRQAR